MLARLLRFGVEDAGSPAPVASLVPFEMPEGFVLRLLLALGSVIELRRCEFGVARRLFAGSLRDDS